jgi:hypothetical protein
VLIGAGEEAAEGTTACTEAVAGTGPLRQASDGPGRGSRGTPQMPGNRSSLRRRGHPARRAAWGLLSLVVLAAGTAEADPAGDPSPVPRLRASSDLDGLHIWLGPIGAATHVDGAWDSAWGGTVAALRIREHAPIGAIGAWIGGAHYALRDGGRVWIDGVVGTRLLGGKMMGLAAGPVVELGDLHHPHAGAQASIWCFAGVVPYARLGVLEASGPFVEVGISLGVPALRF